MSDQAVCRCTEYATCEVCISRPRAPLFPAPHAVEVAPTAARIAAECDALKAMLLAKNAAYGDSVTDPVRVFSGSSPGEQIRVRIDDKISRLSRGHAMADESMRDTVRDLIGYLVLLLIVEES